MKLWEKVRAAGQNGQSSAKYSGQRVVGENGQSVAGHNGQGAAGEKGQSGAGHNGQSAFGKNRQDGTERKQAASGGSALRVGTYSFAVAAIVLAILVAVNVLASALPSTATKFDISAAKLYSVTSNTKVVVNALQQDVTIYWIVQAGEEDDVLENLLAKYESLSEHIKVEKRNPDVYPTFVQQYTEETAANNSLVVESGERSRYIGYDDIYLQEADMYSYSYTTSFDGEEAITSAIDYVVGAEQPQLYLLEGHGEAELPGTFREQIEKENIEIETLSLLTVDKIPAEADVIMIYAPTSDISEEEKTMLADYAAGGGKLLVMAGPTEDDELPNLYGLLSDYGVTVSAGIVIEGDREHYAFQMPYLLLPTVESDEITESLMTDGYFPILPIASGLTVDGGTNGATVTPLLTTSNEAFSKTAGYALSTYEKEDGDIDGPFTLAVKIELLENAAAADSDGVGVSSDGAETAVNSESSGALSNSTETATASDHVGTSSDGTETIADSDNVEASSDDTRSGDGKTAGQIVWFSSSSFLEDMYNAYSSGANGDLAMNALSSMVGESEAMAIRSKSLNYNYLTISESTSSLIKTLLIGVFPLAYLSIGVAVVLVRRKRQNAQG